MSTEDSNAPAAAQPSPAYARMVHRLGIAHGKLKLAAAYWTPANTPSEDAGAVAIVHEVTEELDDLYCIVADFGHAHKHLVNGPLVATFEEAIGLHEHWEEEKQGSEQS